jgi:hypothetical protein
MTSDTDEGARMHPAVTLPWMDGVLVEVPGAPLDDLLRLVDQTVDLLERKESIPATLTAALKGAHAEVRCHSRAGVPA